MTLWRSVLAEQQPAQLLQCSDQRSDSLVAGFVSLRQLGNREMTHTSDIESLAVLGIGAARDVLALLALSNDFGNGDLLVVLSAGAQGCDGSGQEKELLKGRHLD